jgi:predicted O-methyltransferase YrrM
MALSDEAPASEVTRRPRRRRGAARGGRAGKGPRPDARAERRARAASRRRRRTVIALAGIAVVAVATAAAAAVDVALAGVVAVGAVILAVTVLLARRNERTVARLEATARRRSRVMRRREAERDRRIRRLIVRRSRQEFAQLEALGWLIHELPLTRPLPATRGMAAAPDLLVLLVSLIDERRPSVVFEVGSGVSTLVIAARLKALGSGSIVTLEHEPAFAERTRRELGLHGLADVASVVDAPLGDVRVADATWRWYRPPADSLPASIDLLFVDGPPGNVGELARYPALPLLRDRITPGAVIVMDDVIRPDEELIARRWQADVPGSELELLDLESGAAVLRMPVSP